MILLGISGKKQAGKSTVGNFLLSLFLAKLNFCKKILMDEDGQLLISDILGDTRYDGVFSVRGAIEKFHDPRIIEAMERLESKIKIYNFADILKLDICINMLDLNYQQCYGSDEDKNTLTNIKWKDMPICNEALAEYSNKNEYMTAREVMQFIGTDIFRKMDSNVWVRSTINKIIREKPELAVITDCRFPNEVAVIKEIGGKVIRLTRDPFKSEHISETILDKDKYDWNNFDYIMENDDISLYDQFTKIKNLLEEILPL